MNYATQTTRVFRWRRLATTAAAAILALSTPFSGLPAYAAEPAAAPAAGTIYYERLEQIIQRWAVNTGFDHGDMSHGADAQTWSWMHRAPHDWNSQWDTQYVADGYYTFRNRWSDKCLGIDAFAFANRVEQQICNTTSGQLWKYISAGTHNGRYTYNLKNKGLSEKFKLEMVLTADHTGFGAPVRVQNKSASASAQRWFVSVVAGS